MQQPHHATGTLPRAAAAQGVRSAAVARFHAPGRLGDALAAEASRYLAALEVFRREGCRITWAAES